MLEITFGGDIFDSENSLSLAYQRGKRVYDSAKRDCPVKTGALKASIEFKESRNSVTVVAGEEYAVYVDNNTGFFHNAIADAMEISQQTQRDADLIVQHTPESVARTKERLAQYKIKQISKAVAAAARQTPTPTGG